MTNLIATLLLFGYFIVTGILGIVINTFIPLHEEIKRKLLHLFGFASFFIFMFAYKDWEMAVISACAFGICSFFGISVLEHYWPNSTNFLKERFKGEVKFTILAVFLIFALMIAVSWGFLSTSFLGTLAITCWGIGDMCASLIGKIFGKHHFKPQAIEKKTWEGSLSCFIGIFITSLVIMLFYQASIPQMLIIPLLCALVGSSVELITPGGFDTITMPAGLLLVGMLIYVI